MIRKSLIAELFAHNDWSRDKLLSAATPLEDAQLDRAFEMGVGSLRGTLHHLWAAERVWLDRWIPGRKAVYQEQHGDVGLNELWGRFRETAAERDLLLARLDDAALAKPFAFTDSKGNAHTFPLGDLMLHVCNHGIHHRAQAVNMLRHLGATLPKPGVDYIFWRLERAGGSHGATPGGPAVTPPPAADSSKQRAARPEIAAPTFTVDSITAFFAYADWARDRVHAAAAKLTDAQLDRPFEMGVGTLRKTLLHTRFAEEWWFGNWTDGAGRPFPELPEQTPIANLQALFAETAARRNDYLVRLKDAELQRTVEACPRPDVRRVFPLGVTMVQLCCHGTHHRAQALNMLRHVGASVPGIDYVTMLREQH